MEQIFDDGTSLIDTGPTMYAYGPDGTVMSAVDDDGSYRENYQYADDAEAAKLEPFYPPGRPWWESVAMYGVTRAIDSHFGPKAPDKSTAGGSYAGQNGRTYTTGRNGMAQGDNTLMLMLMAGAAFLLLG